MKETAIYIHIPFCDHKCIYCDFYSIITKDNIGSFLNAITKEIEFYSGYNKDRIFTSIFFGGGTPSLMEPDFLKEILETIKRNFFISNDCEITMETNPGTVNKDKLTEFHRSGISRISIGIQTFHDDELKFLTRIHDKSTAIDTVINAYKAGFENINVDLIFNLPGQSKNKWRENLIQAVNLPIKHISAYSLILENGTILNKMVLDGKVKMQDDDYDAGLYEYTIDFLTSAGFNQYEVSNFSFPGYECRHNNAYWQYRDYIGFGPSAHSFMDGKRWWNYSSLKRYISEIEHKGNALMNSELLTKDEMQGEYIMLALRSTGINLSELENKFGDKWLSNNNVKLTKLAENNFIVYKDDHIKLTSKGYALCDEILRIVD